MNVPPHEVYNPNEYNAPRSAGNEIVFGRAPADDGNQYHGGGYEESKAQPSYDQNQYAQQDSYKQAAPAPQSYAQPPAHQAEAPQPAARGNSRGGGVQLPIANKDYSAYGGNSYNQGAGVGMGYSQPMQQEMPVQAKGFEGGAGTKFY